MVIDELSLWSMVTVHGHAWAKYHYQWRSLQRLHY